MYNKKQEIEMVLDSIENATRYVGLNPLFEKAFQFIKQLDASNLPDGSFEIEGDSLKGSVVSADLKSRTEARLEIHRRFIDIQIPVAKEEIFGWRSLKTLNDPMGEFDSQNDFQLFDDEPSAYIRVNPGQFIIFFPEDAHTPLIGEGNTRKVILKVSVQ